MRDKCSENEIMVKSETLRSEKLVANKGSGEIFVLWKLLSAINY